MRKFGRELKIATIEEGSTLSDLVRDSLESVIGCLEIVDDVDLNVDWVL